MHSEASQCPLGQGGGAFSCSSLEPQCLAQDRYMTGNKC